MKWLAAAGLSLYSLFGADIQPSEYLAHVRYLASPELKGRLTGSPELNEAARYIQAQFRRTGVQPVNGSYFQDFEVTAKTALGTADRAQFTVGSITRKLGEGADFVPLNLSSNGTATGPLVFVGYGITDDATHYNDYAGVSARDAIVLVIRHEPKEGKEFSENAHISSKIVNAKLHGAKAVLLVNDSPRHGGADELEKFTPVTATEDYGILVDQISSKAADRLLGLEHRTLAGTIDAIEKDGRPHSFAFSGGGTAALTVAIQEEKRRVHNVVGFVPGQTAEYIVLGAHYDHLGLGEQNSLAPSLMGTVHPGADDNASGTAGVIELGRVFAKAPKQKRGFLLLCFAGEEEGLLGSAYYVSHPLKPLNNAIAMINMDMIGRLRDNKVYVGGVGTGSTFEKLLSAANERYHFQEDRSEAGGYGSSDHTSFTTKHVPTLFFFSGLHSDYHKPSDTADKINAPEAARLLDEIADLSEALAAAPGRPEFVRVQPNPHEGDVSSSGGGSGYGPYFGSIPDFGGPADGVRFSDVRDGSPAASAGFRAGDVMVNFDGKRIQNLYDFTYALRQHKEGDVVLVKVLRDGKPVEAKVTLTKRN